MEQGVWYSMSMEEEQEQETPQYEGKLGQIAERVEMDRLTCEAMGWKLNPHAQDRQDLMDIVNVAFGEIEKFKKMAANVRYNNHGLNPQWEARADAYENASDYLSVALGRAADRLDRN